MKICEWCTKVFDPIVSYQIYCSPECRTDATKEKILERHKVLKRQKRKNKIRYCAGDCGTKLSIYNDSKYCDNCVSQSSQVNKTMRQIKAFMHDYEDKTK